MKKDLIITRNGYDFGHDWQLHIEKDGQEKTFYLGQDAKVCARIIGMSGREVVNQVGSNDMSLESTREAIATMILEAMGFSEDNEDQLFNTPPWELAAE